MSQNHKLIAIDASKMRALCKSARGGGGVQALGIKILIMQHLVHAIY
jgi:hypothetical protein